MHLPYCNRQEEETVKHHLIECPLITRSTKQLLPPNPSITNLFGDAEQLKRASTYYYMAQGKKERKFETQWI